METEQIKALLLDKIEKNKENINLKPYLKGYLQGIKEFGLITTNQKNELINVINSNILDEEILNINSYLNNLKEEGLKQALIQLIKYPESRSYLLVQLKEWNKFYGFPLNKGD